MVLNDSGWLASPAGTGIKTNALYTVAGLSNAMHAQQSVMVGLYRS